MFELRRRCSSSYSQDCPSSDELGDAEYIFTAWNTLARTGGQRTTLTGDTLTLQSNHIAFTPELAQSSREGEKPMEMTTRPAGSITVLLALPRQLTSRQS